jgi:hypothetical protein
MWWFSGQMISSLNRMLSSMDALADGKPGPVTAVGVVGMDVGDAWMQDTSYVTLQMPSSDISCAYDLHNRLEYHNYSIKCKGGEIYPIDRFFAMLLFEPIKRKELSAAPFAGVPNQFDMDDVIHEELSGLLKISFCKSNVELRMCDLVRCAKVAHKYEFWKPVTYFLWYSVYDRISHSISEISSDVKLAMDELDAVRRSQMLQVTPLAPLPKRYAFSMDAVQAVVEGRFYGECDDDLNVPVVCAESAQMVPGSGVNGSAFNVYVLTWPRLSLRVVPMHKLRALLDFDTVGARVGYPVFSEVVGGHRLSMLERGELDRYIGLFCVYSPLYTEGRTYTVMANDYTFAFVLGFSGAGAYVLLRSGVLHVELGDLCVIERGRGEPDAASCRRANLILKAAPRPRDDMFGDEGCGDITRLRVGTYYHCPACFLFGDPLERDSRYSRTPVLYLGAASATHVYVYGHKREAMVEFRYLRFLDREEAGPEDEGSDPAEWDPSLDDMRS